MNISVVTTFHKTGYDQYGKRMIQTFLKNWPSTIKLYVYAENCHVDEQADNLVVKDLHSSSKELVDFKSKWKDVPYANGDVSSIPRLAPRKDNNKAFKWDAIRFAHKVYAIFDCAKICQSDVLFWMDADTVCHSPISQTTVEKFCPISIDLGYLGRDYKYSECGLYSLNLKSKSTLEFLKEFQRMYDQADLGIFQLNEWHDSFVFDAVRKNIAGLKEYNWSEGIIAGEGHPLINSEWGAYLDHLKGQRKVSGKSLRKDLKVARKEDYWK